MAGELLNERGDICPRKLTALLLVLAAFGWMICWGATTHRRLEREHRAEWGVRGETTCAPGAYMFRDFTTARRIGESEWEFTGPSLQEGRGLERWVGSDCIIHWFRAD
jgi:hypothetical protein